MCKKANTGIKSAYSFAVDKDKIYIQLPPGTVFFGGRIRRAYCRLMGVDYFTQIIDFHEETMILEITIPHVQDPDLFKNRTRTESADDLYDTLCEDDEEEESVIYECWGDYIVPRKRPRWFIHNLPLALRLPHGKSSSRSKHKKSI